MIMRVIPLTRAGGYTFLGGLPQTPVIVPPTGDDYADLMSVLNGSGALLTLDAGRTYHLTQTPSIQLIGKELNLNGATLIRDDVTDALGSYKPGVSGYIYESLQFLAGSHDCEIYGGHFAGLRTRSDWTNAQMASIGIRGTTCHDLYFHDCVFTDNVGFPIHNEAGGDSIEFAYCEVSNAGNGVNINCDHFYMHDCTLTLTEGVECSGAYALIEDNTLTNMLAGGISLGGDTHLGRMESGSIVRRNAINGVTYGNRIGIIIADGQEGALVEMNDVRGCEIGMQVLAQSNYVKDTIIRNNVFTLNTKGMYMPDYALLSGGITAIYDNNCAGNTAFNLIAESPYLNVYNNDFRTSGNQNVLLKVFATGMTFVLNTAGVNPNLYTKITDQRTA